MKIKNIKDYLKRYGWKGTWTFTHKIILQKLTGARYKHLFYYVFDLENLKNEAEDFSVRELTEQDFIKSRAGDPKWFTEKKMRKILSAFKSENQIAYGLIEGNKILCYSFLNTKMRSNSESYYPWGEEDAYLWDDYTHPDFRGKGLHRKMIHLRLLKAKEMGKKYAWSMVNNYNRASFKNFESLGFKKAFEVATREKVKKLDDWPERVK